MDLLRKTGKAIRQFLRVYRPISKAGGIVLPAPKPPIIEHEEFDPELRCTLCDFEETLLGEVEVGSFPVVHENRTLMILPASSNDVPIYESMEVQPRTVHPLVGVGENRFGGVQLLSCVELPSECGRIQTGEHSHLPVWGDLHTLRMVSTIDQVTAKAIPMTIIVWIGHEEDTGVMSSGARPGLRVVHVNSRTERLHRSIPFPCPGTIEGDEIVCTGMKIELHTGESLNVQRLTGVVGESRPPRNHIGMIKGGVVEFKANRARLFQEYHDKGGALILVSVRFW